MTSFGQLLKTHRLQRGMIQTNLAARVGVNGSYIARLENDQRHPTRRVALKLAAVLNLSADERDQLLAAAYHLPVGDIQRLAQADGINQDRPIFHTIAQTLQDLNPKHRDILEQEIISYTTFRVRQLKHEERAAARHRILEYA